MFRTVLSFLVLLTVCSFANSESPTKSNWASGLDRYIGKFHMINDENKPTRKIESYWVEPNKIFQYHSFSIGDVSNSRGVGFCFWNEEKKRPEFNELEFRDGERFVYEGYCVDMTETTMTWLVTEWSREGVISMVEMTDTHNVNGLNRSTKHIMGKEDNTNIVKWIRVNKDKTPSATTSSSPSKSITADNAPFVSSRGSRLFHYGTCRIVERIKETNKISYSTYEEASSRKKLAGCCKPVEEATETPPEIENDPAPETDKSSGSYCITKSSGVRHNSFCRYYQNASCVPCGPNEGRACKKCGG